MTNNNFRTILSLSTLLLLGSVLFGQNEVTVSTDFLGDSYQYAYIISHTQENGIFDAIKIDPTTELPDYFNIQVPNDSNFHAISLLVNRGADFPDYYHQFVNCYTVWDNRNDTINNVTLGIIPGNTLKNKKIEVNIQVKEIGKLDDLYSLSTRENLKDKVSRLAGKKDIEFGVDSYTGVGRCIYLANKKDDNYREIIIHPNNSARYNPEIVVAYEDLPVHTNRKMLDIKSSNRAFVQINANTTEGGVYNIYTSPRSLETFDELEIDIPVGIEITDYNFSAILRDFDAYSDKILVKSIGQRISTLDEIQLPQVIEDVSHFITTSDSKYSIDLEGNKFDKWALRFEIEGLVKTGIRIPWEYYRTNNWIIYGNVSNNSFEVFLPYLTDEIRTRIFGPNGHINEDEGNWNFTRQKDSTYREVSSLQKL